MNPPSSSPSQYPSKRARRSTPDATSPPALNPALLADPSPSGESPEEGGSGGKAGQSSSFRNVSACNRCRLRKNKCDHRLPSCASCEKASVKCVGYDPITKREIPRSYVYYLEARVGYLETLLHQHQISFAPAEALDSASKPGPDPNAAQAPSGNSDPTSNGSDNSTSAAQRAQNHKEERNKKNESNKLEKLVSNVGTIPVQGVSDPRYLGSTSGISFARVVFAAVKSSVSGTSSDKGGVKPSKPVPAKAAGTGGTSMRDSFFGLHTKPTIKQAPFPDREVGFRLVTFYFEHANPQVPILHRGDFMKMFDEVYSGTDRPRTPRESYMLNIVFAIGAGIFLGDSGPDKGSDSEKSYKKQSLKSPVMKRGKPRSKQAQPEEYHASAIVHLEACLSASSGADRADGFGGGLEELQAVLLLAGFALLRPIPPGLWYIVGVAVRLAVDLGLHYEDGKDIDTGLEGSGGGESKAGENDNRIQSREGSARERGRREWIRDFRRRLWWCTYSFDRLVSTCVGRPFGITDAAITTEFPSLLEDKYITPQGFLEPLEPNEATYKHISYHYFRFRLLQSEILQVLQFQQAQAVRAGGTNQRNPYMHTQLPSPFLSKFDSFRTWRIDIDRRLWQWKESAPTRRENGVEFCPEFLELNYWQAVIMLYRQSLSTPPQFEGEYNTAEEVNSPSAHTVESREDEERVFLKVAEAGQKVLRLYRQLHRVHLVNYTFLATHHLFMAGISFLYAIWHSPIVRSRLTMDEVDFTILAATSVLGDLIEMCPPAEACRDAFNRMSKATVQMCMSTTGFGSGAQGLHYRSHRPQTKPEDVAMDHFNVPSSKQYSGSNSRGRRASPRHQRSTNTQQIPPPSSTVQEKAYFDMGLNNTYTAPSGISQTQSQGKMQQPYQSPDQTSNNGSRRQEFKSEFSPNEGLGISGSQIQSPGDYSISPPPAQIPFEAPAIDPSLLPSPLSQPRGFAAHDPNSMSLNPSLFSNFSDADFQSMDFLMQGTDGLHDSLSAGMEGDLGFGLGWEGPDHDFSEGNNVDLFDGFFFGGPAAGYNQG